MVDRIVAELEAGPYAMVVGSYSMVDLSLNQIPPVLARRPNEYQWPPSGHDPPQPGSKCGTQHNRQGARDMALGKIYKRADVDHDRTRRQLATKFVTNRSWARTAIHSDRRK